MTTSDEAHFAPGTPSGWDPYTPQAVIHHTLYV
jgi:hypothetical protein